MSFSFAQNGEDILLWRCFGAQRTGFYVDVGASSPIQDSVTQLFYEAGWSGLNIEPIPERVAELRRARPRDVTLCAAAGEQAGTISLVRTAGLGGLSTAVPLDQLPPVYAAHSWPIAAQQITLSDALAAHCAGPIDFLKIDAEDAEARVLSGLDLRRWRPALIVVEATRPLSSEPNHQAWEPMLLAADYAPAWFDGLNRTYLAAERDAELRPHFATPPNVFDGFTAYQALGRPLNNSLHPEHGFALHFAQLLLRALGTETDAYLEAVFRADQPPDMLAGRPTPAAVQGLYALVLARAASAGELALAAADPELTGGGLIRRLIGSEEFRTRRTRIAL
jgi:FkbM family methyltransferase